jgi:hypothetical protein
MKPLLLLIAIAIGLVSCKQSPSGTYQVYKQLDELNALQMASPTHSLKDDINQRIESAFMGKKFNIDFQADYISFNGGSYDNIILNKKVGNENIGYYLGEHLFGNTTIQLRMMPNDTDYLVMAVDARIPNDSPAVIPAQLGGLFLTDKSQRGRVIFVLKKIQ